MPVGKAFQREQESGIFFSFFFFLFFEYRPENEIVAMILWSIFALKLFVTSPSFEQKLEYLWNKRRYFRNEYNTLICHSPNGLSSKHNLWFTS